MNYASPMIEIANSLTYLGCLMSGGKLPDVDTNALKKFLSGEVYSFPEGSSIVFKNGRIRLVTVTNEATKNFWLKNRELVTYIEHFANELAFVQELQKSALAA
jgi:hypothetical protein